MISRHRQDSLLRKLKEIFKCCLYLFLFRIDSASSTSKNELITIVQQQDESRLSLCVEFLLWFRRDFPLSYRYLPFGFHIHSSPPISVINVVEQITRKICQYNLCTVQWISFHWQTSRPNTCTLCWKEELNFVIGLYRSLTWTVSRRRSIKSSFVWSVDVTMSLGHNVKMRAEKRWETRKTTVVTWPRRTSEISPPKARWMHHPFLGDGFLQPWYDIDRRLSSKHVAALVPWVKQLLTQKHSWRYCDDVLSRGFSISTNRRNRKYAFVISHLAYFQRASCKLCWKYFNFFH